MSEPSVFLLSFFFFGTCSYYLTLSYLKNNNTGLFKQHFLSTLSTFIVSFIIVPIVFMNFFDGTYNKLQKNTIENNIKTESVNTNFPTEIIEEKQISKSEFKQVIDEKVVINQCDNCFTFSFDEFVERFNTASTTIDNNMVLAVFKESTDYKGENIIINAVSNKNVSVIITANKEDKKVSSFLFIGVGDGSTQSGADIIIGLLCSIMAVENPIMPKDERTLIMKKLLLLNGQFFKKNKAKLLLKSGKYELSFSKYTGMLLSATPK